MDPLEFTVTNPQPLDVTFGGTQGPAGPPGASGAPGVPGPAGSPGSPGSPGPNQVTNTTSTNLTGLLYGNGTVVSAATTEQVRTAADLPSALSPYLLAALAANTYVPQSRTITINGTTQDLTANRSWTITTTPAAGSIVNSQLANVATSTIKGRISASTGVVEDLTPAQARSVLGLATTDAPTFAGGVFTGSVTIAAPLVLNGGVQGSPSFSVTSNMIVASNNLGAAGLLSCTNGWGTLSGGQVSALILAQTGAAPGGIVLSPGTGAGGNTVAQRNGTNAQRFEVYGSFADAANFRRLFISSTTAGAFAIGVEGLGTGASGNTLTIASNPIISNGQLVLGTGMFPSWVRNDGTWGTVISTGASGTGGVGVAVSSMLPAGVSMSLGEIGFSGWTYLLLLSGGQGGILRPNGAGVLEVRNAANNAFGSLNLLNITATGSQITFSGLPTTNPGVAGRLWNDGGTLKVS